MSSSSLVGREAEYHIEPFVSACIELADDFGYPVGVVPSVRHRQGCLGEHLPAARKPGGGHGVPAPSSIARRLMSSCVRWRSRLTAVRTVTRFLRWYPPSRSMAIVREAPSLMRRRVQYCRGGRSVLPVHS